MIGERTAPAGPRTLVTVCVLVAVASAAFLWRLDEAPVYLSPDEAIISVDAHAIATTGRDVYGRRLPLYFQVQMPGDDRSGWFTPAIIYLSALCQKVWPLSERVARLPSVLIGVLNVALLYAVGRRLFRNESLAILAAALLLITPAHFLLSRFALDYEYPLPFMLGWLACLLWFLETGRRAALLSAVVCLGVGFYSYISAIFMMPLYFALTLYLLARQGAPRRQVALAMAVFVALLLPFFVWLMAHPAAIVDTVQRYEIYDARRLNPLQGLRALLGYQSLDLRATLYWSHFNPSFLFFSGDQLITFSTRQTGVFLLPMAFVVALGIYEVLRPPRAREGLLVLAGFLTAPLAAVLATTEPGAIIRAAGLIPFGVLLAVYGFRYLLTEARSRSTSRLPAIGIALAAGGGLYLVYLLLAQHRVSASATGLALAGAALVVLGRTAVTFRPGPWLAAALGVAMLIQFGAFWTDYFGSYRLRSAPWLSGNLPGALETLIALDQQGPVPGVYFTVLRSTSGLLDTRNRWMGSYWAFYTAKHRRDSLLTRTTRAFEAADAAKVPAGSLLLAYVDDRTVAQLVANHTLTLVQVIPELDRPPFFAIFKR